MTQKALAELAGTSQATVAAYETGRKSPTLKTVARLARSAGFSMHVEFVPPLTREDRRSLAFHEAIAERLRADPTDAMHKAERHLEALKRLHPHAGRLLNLWSAWLALAVDDLVAQLLDPGMLARDMRQVSPFVGVLCARERAAILRAFRAAEEAA